ncbi:MAG: AraC family transcriptional regulator [Balneolaceae bacterium]
MENFFDFIKENPSVKRHQVNDLLFAEYQCPLSETRYDIWSHHNYFIYVTSGQKKWFTLNQEALVQQGDCLFVRKGGHSVYQYFDSDFCALVMFVPDAFIRSVLLESRIKTGNPDDHTEWDSLFSIKADNQLAAYFNSFLSYLSASDTPEDKLLELKFRELIMVIASGTGNKKLSGYFAGLCKTDKPTLQEVMEANYTYPMNLEEYARLSRRSLSTFKRDFSEIYHTTPGRWLTKKRLDLAKYLLKHTNKTVTETVLDCGFKNVSHFSRIFRETYDITPLEYSKKQPEQAK